MLSATAHPDPSRCPGCGAGNQCATAAGQPPRDCWCMAAPGLALPLPAGAAACYCATCLRRRQPEVPR